MKSNNNKIFSSLLLLTALSSMVAGALSINNNVYRKAEAASSYKTVFLTVPGDIMSSLSPGHVTKSNGSDDIPWDAEENQVRVYDFKTSIGVDPGHVMNKIDDHIFAYTLYLNPDSDNFIFTTKINGVLYRSHQDGGGQYRFKDVSSSKNLLTMYHYDCTTRDGPGSWDSATNIATNADEYYNIFLAVVGAGTCDDGGDTNIAKLTAVWTEMSGLVNNSFKQALIDAEIAGSAPENKFAALYNYICWKYDGTLNNFLNREITSLANVAKYNPVVTDNNSTRNIIVVVSISGVSLSIVGLYFFLRKRKEK